MPAEVGQHWICCYDIRSAKRLVKMHKLLSMLGIAMNYSVFYLTLSMKQFFKLCQSITRLIKPEDDVRLYRCAGLDTAMSLTEKGAGNNLLIGAKGVLL